MGLWGRARKKKRWEEGGSGKAIRGVDLTVECQWNGHSTEMLTLLSRKTSAYNKSSVYNQRDQKWN